MKKIVIVIAIICMFILSIIWNIKTNPWNICVNKEKNLGYTTSEAYKYCAKEGY